MKHRKPSGLMFVLALVLLLPTIAMGHAHLSMSIPTRDATVTTPISEVRLRFTEAVETQFSMFKVYPLQEVESDGDINQAARSLVDRVIRLRGDEANRADAGLVTTARTSPEIVIRLKENLEPGAYVVMWRVLSVDTHTTDGFIVFHYEPEA